MRRVVMSVAVLLTVWFLVADSASAGRRHRSRCCEPCHVRTCCNPCGERTACCQPAPCCQSGGSHQMHQKPVMAPETPKAPLPEEPKTPPDAPKTPPEGMK
jgi:hypothetical protein